MRFSISKLIYLTVFIAILASCQSTLIDSEPEPEEKAYDYFIQTRELIREPSDTLFWNRLLKNKSKYPEETGKLIDEYIIFQKELIRHFIDMRDVNNAIFHLNNLRALPEQTGAFITFEMLEKEVRGLKDNLVSERNKTLLAEGFPFVGDSLEPAQYRRAIGVIRINFKWETDSGIERENYNDMMGSGILITPRHVLTAFHVVDIVFDEELTESHISVDFDEDTYDDVQLISWDSLTDLAVLELPEPVSNPYLYELLKTENEVQKQGDTIYTHGHPYGYTYTFSKGVISSVERDAPEWGQWIQIDASIGPGSSGGLLLSQQGNVAGLVVAGVNNEDMNFAVPAEIIRNVIDPMIDGRSVKRPWSGLLFGLNDDSLSLSHIFEESPLVDTGLERGDKMVAVNGVHIEDLEEAKAEIDQFSAENLITLTFSNGAETYSDYTFKMMRRPDYALYNKILRMDAFDRLSVAAGILVDSEDRVSEKFSDKERIRYFQSFPVVELEESGILYKRGVRPGDRIGVFEDQFKDEKYKITMIHIPEGKTLETLEDPEDMIFTLTKGKYNEYIY